MSNHDLEPCPFCDMPVTLESGTTDGILCFACPDDSPCRDSGLGIYALARKRETAIAAWNRRALLEPQS